MMMKMTTMKMKTSTCLCLLSAVISMISLVNSSNDIIATCTMNSLQQPNRTVSGNVTFRQSGNTTVVTGLLTGFTWGGKHGFHIHQNGNLGNSCDAAGLHYNPLNTTHGPQDANITMRHVGDLGNIDVDANMTANFTIVDSIIQLQGNYSVVGRALVVHSGTDDLGRGNSTSSTSTGDSGYKIGCCIIEISGSNGTTTAPVNGSSTTRGPTGSAASVGPPLAAVSAACLAAAVQLMFSLG